MAPRVHALNPDSEVPDFAPEPEDDAGPNPWIGQAPITRLEGEWSFTAPLARGPANSNINPLLRSAGLRLNSVHARGQSQRLSHLVHF